MSGYWRIDSVVSNRPCGIGSILLYIFNMKKIKLDYSGEYSTNEIIKYFIVHLDQSAFQV